jgi:hypothetical protein
VLGLSGKTTAVSTSQSTGFAAAGSLDRYFRLLSSPLPRQDISAESGQVVGKFYITVAPSAIVPLTTGDGGNGTEKADNDKEDADGEADWEGLQRVSDEDEEESKRISKKRRKKV